ncbi:hypothetical protein [Novosphingobium sp. KACC 22771]|uniref:hypothetical protein n=1 Tax=Novosphingobium sp. KACC 22771 TaxID=3025670 RepID=UPI00236729D0|nr:hypothetical protein [Novosphingobium sp. KACC 22771]WDF72230.1 hypothetical protein PQ467_15775 [Novosphingobium sp. KACC 22771]
MLGPIAKFASSPSPSRRARGDRFAHAARFALPALLLSALLGGCGTASYPSLGRRAEEKPVAAPTTAVAVAAPDEAPSGLGERIDSLLRAAREADAGFSKARTAADKALNAAANAHPGDEAWQQANLALTDLERQRGALGLVEGDIEELYTQDRVAHGAENPDAPRAAARMIAAARSEILALGAAQDRTLEAARRKLPR